MQSKNLGYLPRVDHLRFLAFFLVFLFHVYHYFYHGWKPNSDAAVIGFIVEGHTGVGLFFTLSGFLFMLIALSGSITYKAFIYNRFLRIFPLFLVVFYLAISLGRDGFSASDILYLGFSNIGTPPTSDFFVTGASWTISVEFTFYLIFPFLARFFLDNGYGYLVGLFCLLLVFKVAAYFIVDNPIHVFYSTLLGRFDQFLIGMAAGRLFHDHRHRLASLAWPLMGVSILWMYGGLWGLAKYASWMSDDKHQPIWIIWSSIEATGWAMVICSYLLLPDSRFAVMQGSGAVMRYCGKISFSLYLLHALVLFLFNEFFGSISITPWFPVNFLLSSMAMLLFCVVLASLSYNCIEAPFLRLRKRYIHTSDQSE